MNNFQELGLEENILKALSELGITEPTEIQQQAIPYLLSSTDDFIGLAQTGTGKTAAFGLPLIAQVSTQDTYCQAIVLSPTRELAQQIAEGLKSFSKYMKKLKVECVYGGAPIMTQMRNLKSKPQIVVATPGRLVDLIKRKALDVTKLRYVVLDEADEMLNMGFKEDLNTILEKTPDEKSTWLFSATMPKMIRKIIDDYMHNPHEISVKSGVEVNKNIAHQYMVVKVSDKLEAIKRFIDMEADLYGVMFCRTKIDTQNIADELSRAGYTAEAIHGDLSQNQRDLVMRKFKDRAVKLLVATDVAARGIDVNDVTHVIHHRLPDELEFYTHRSGRTARAGKKGISIALISKNEKRRLDQIEKILGISFEKTLIPTGDAIATKRLDVWSKRILEKEVGKGIPSEVKEKVLLDLADVSKEDLIEKLLVMEFDKLNLSDNRDLNVNAASSSSRDGKGRGDRNENAYVKYVINIGKIDSISKGDVANIVSEVSGIRASEIGRIETQQKRTVFEIGKPFSDGFSKKFEGFQFDDRDIKVTDGGEFMEANQNSRNGRGRGRSDRRKSFGGGGGRPKGRRGDSRRR